MPTRAETDAVVGQVIGGNRDAFRLIVREFSLPLRCYIASQVHHPDDIDDITQDVFLAAYRELACFRRGEDFGAWLRGIARNKVVDYFRSRARREKAMERFCEEVARFIQDDLQQVAAGETAESIEALLSCIGRLPEKLRRVVRAGLRGEKATNLAEELLSTVGAIYNLQYRANQLLRDCVKEKLG